MVAKDGYESARASLMSDDKSGLFVTSGLQAIHEEIKPSVERAISAGSEGNFPGQRPRNRWQLLRCR